MTWALSPVQMNEWSVIASLPVKFPAHVMVVALWISLYFKGSNFTIHKKTHRDPKNLNVYVCMCVCVYLFYFHVCILFSTSSKPFVNNPRIIIFFIQKLVTLVF